MPPQLLDRPAVSTGPARQRLPAELRTHQILDAALHTFARNGFAETRIDDIAHQAGLSKGGVYTHFKSKEEIFEALLDRELLPRAALWPVALPAEDVTVDLLIERVFDPIYDALQQENKALIFGLLLSNGARIPELSARCEKTVSEPHLAAITLMLKQGVAQGHLRDGIGAKEPRLLLGPVAYACVVSMGNAQRVSQTLARFRKAHMEMLRELLAVPET